MLTALTLPGSWTLALPRAASRPSILWQPAATRSRSKVPEVLFGFWIIKIAATTLGETGGDALSMSLGLGYLPSTFFLGSLLLILLAAQLRARTFRPFLYWGVVVATTLAGTTLADFADRSLGIGYPGGATLLAAAVLTTLAAWKLTLGSVSIHSVNSPAAEVFYWATILFSNTLGTALGDWTSEGTGFGGGVFLFLGLLAAVLAFYAFTRVSRTVLFWVAFVLTRPLGASLGDLLTKPHAAGGLDLSRLTSSAVLAVFIVACILLFPQRPADHPGATP